MLLNRLAADAILFTHFLFVVFVVVGFILILLGLFLQWKWARHFWLRLAHLAAIAFVLLETCLGLTCPLTLWESQLRANAGGASYPGDFLAYWASKLLFCDAPSWVFVVCYFSFGLAVLLSWILAPPHWPWKTASKPNPISPQNSDQIHQ